MQEKESVNFFYYSNPIQLKKEFKNKFFSARRALKQKHNDYGRNISIIMIK